MRNNLSRPSIGHVIMFGAVSLGWLLLFLITLASPGSSTYWIKLVFSGLFLAGSAVATVLLLVRVLRARKAAGRP